LLADDLIVNPSFRRPEKNALPYPLALNASGYGSFFAG
jgi:hypothetical protein